MQKQHSTKQYINEKLNCIPKPPVGPGNENNYLNTIHRQATISKSITNQSDQSAAFHMNPFNDYKRHSLTIKEPYPQSNSSSYSTRGENFNPANRPNTAATYDDRQSNSFRAPNPTSSDPSLKTTGGPPSYVSSSR